jgi:hypothetical protein
MKRNAQSKLQCLKLLGNHEPFLKDLEILSDAPVLVKKSSINVKQHNYITVGVG